MKITRIFAAVFLAASCQVSAADAMPEDILNAVKSNLAERYPDNYSVQNTLLKGQIEAYEFLQTYKPDGVPADVLERIIEKVAGRYPNNFSVQKTLVEGQVQSYKDLQ